MLLNKTGLLLVNLGTPDDPSVKSVRRYLKQFLSDPRVIAIPGILRWLLLRLIILPFRAPKSAKAYAEIWQADGSPLLVNSIKLSNSIKDKFNVALGMRYGKPSISEAIESLGQVDKIVVLPLFPQYSSAATGSAIEEVLRVLSRKSLIPNIEVINDFYHDPVYIKTIASTISPHLAQGYDYLLTSYHGLPERQAGNYRADCFATSKLIADQLHLPQEKWGVSFQSRLGRVPWIKPYTDEVLPMLYNDGIRDLLICCPSFVADCLETLEEIGLRAKEQWQALGGGRFKLISCLNHNGEWISGLRAIQESGLLKKYVEQEDVERITHIVT